SKLRAGELFLKEKQGGRSDVWDKFAELVDLDDKMIGCCNLDNQSKITSFLQKNEAPANVKELIKKKSINFVCRDLRPFEIVSGKGFQEFAQELVNIGSVYGVAFTTDCWTDDYRKISYISLTVHYIDGWILKEQILAVSKFSDTSHTAENIKNNIFGILKKYNLSPEINMTKYTFVTDSAANFVAAFRNHGCKSLVTYFKQSSLYCRLEKSLKQESESRWNSKLEMLESISDQFEMIYDLLTEKDQLERVEIIDITIVEILINFLKKFHEASECLEASKYPTIHLVLPWYKTLLIHSLFFDPQMKQLKILESYDAEWVKNEIRHQYEILSFQLASDKNNDDGSGEDDRPIKRKKKKSNVDLTDFSQFYDSDNDETEENEIEKYLSSKVQKELDLNILE
ncbi:475_t:CDS:2, partial [Entrophospora sp. SA101]